MRNQHFCVNHDWQSWVPIVKDWAPGKALFWPKMLKPTLKTPKNVMVTSCLRRKVFEGENGPHIVSLEFPTTWHAIIKPLSVQLQLTQELFLLLEGRVI